MSSRYMIVTYYRQITGKWDEVTEFKNSLKPRHYQTAKVILDFKEQKCVVNTINPNASYDDMLEFYKRLIGDQLTPHLPKD